MKDRSPVKEPGPFDAGRTPTENVRSPAPITDKREISLFLMQDAGLFLKGTKQRGPKPQRNGGTPSTMQL
jgi:hypothetical protein